MITPWHDFVEWDLGDEGDAHVAKVGDFELRVWFDDDGTWHHRVLYQGMLTCEGQCRDVAHGARACMRTAVKMAAFHGMELPIEIMRKVAGLLIDPHGVPDPDNPGKIKPARRVAIDGPSPKMLARAAAAKTASEERDP